MEKQAAHVERKAKRNFEKKLTKDKSTNSKPFMHTSRVKQRAEQRWDHCETRIKHGSSNEGKAGILNEFFSSVFLQRRRWTSS